MTGKRRRDEDLVHSPTAGTAQSWAEAMAPEQTAGIKVLGHHPLPPSCPSRALDENRRAATTRSRDCYGNSGIPPVGLTHCVFTVTPEPGFFKDI